MKTAKRRLDLKVDEDYIAQRKGIKQSDYEIFELSEPTCGICEVAPFTSLVVYRKGAGAVMMHQQKGSPMYALAFSTSAADGLNKLGYTLVEAQSLLPIVFPQLDWSST